MEALVVVAIIAISAAIAAPAITEALADQRAGEAAGQVVRIGVRGQTEALAYGRAHLLRFEDIGTGRVTLWRGRSSLCSANNWDVIATGACDGNQDCLGVVDMTSYSISGHTVELALEGGVTLDALCFQPDGEQMYGTGNAFSPISPDGTDAVRFTVTRVVNGSNAGVPRTVLYPIGGTPRLLR